MQRIRVSMKRSKFMKKYKVIVLGTGKSYDEHLGEIKYEEAKGNIEVVGVISRVRYYDSLDGYRGLDWSALKKETYDYIILADEYNVLKEPVLEYGIDENILLNIEIFSIPNFDFPRYIEVYNSNITIISNNCWAGLTYHLLRMQFKSPTINLWIADDEYLKMLENFDYYLSQELVLDRTGFDERLNREYPIGRLDDAHLHFNHYKNFEDAKIKWEIRKNRMNKDNMFFSFHALTLEDAEKFDRLPFKNKKVYTLFENNLESAVCLANFSPVVNNECEQQFWKVIIGFAVQYYKYYDVLKLLNNEKDFLRIKY